MKLIRLCPILVTALPVTSFASDVFLDWDGAMVTMASAWSAAGYSPGAALTPMEISSIIATSKGKIEGKFAGYTVSFVDAPTPGLYEWIKLGSTTASTITYGLSSGIDWRNTIKDGSAEIYLANFGTTLSSTMFTRGENMARLSAAIANTTSHELGHNLGLQHYDAYGIPTVTAPSYGFSGEQNFSVMATGVTGLTAPMRGHDRFFNPLEMVKLEYADGVAPALGSTVLEAAGAKDTLATAQTIYGSTLSLTAATAVNVDGTMTDFGQVDIYKFFAEAGAHISANTLSHGILPSFTDTTMFLLDSSGAGLHMSTDIHFFGDSFMTPTSDYYSDDSLFFNYVAPYTGSYYLKVTGTTPGDYDLLMVGVSTVPEPATCAVMALGVIALLRRKRR